MNVVRHCFGRDEIFKLRGMKSLVFRGRGGSGGVFFRIRRSDNEIILVIDVVDFIFVCDCEMYCGGVGGVVGGVGSVGVKYRDIIDIETGDTHIFAF